MPVVNLARRPRWLRRGLNLLGLITGSLGKIALDVMIMASTEFAELYEPFVKGRGASPHDAAEAQPDLVRADPRRVEGRCASMPG